MQEELRLAKAQAEQAAKTKACLLEAAPVFFIGIDAEGVIFEWSPAAERIFGISIVDALGLRFRSLPIPWNWEAIEQAISRCRETLGRVTVEAVAVHRPDQSDALLRLILTPLLDDQTVSLVLMGEDITERRRLERDMAQAQKLEAIGQLAAGIAHELNTPIQYVGDNVRFFREAWADLSPLFDTLAGHAAHAQGATSPAQLAVALDELCRRVDLDYLREEIPKALAQSLEGLERVATIVRAMRNFAHPDTGDKVLTDLNQAIESTAVVSRNEWKYVAELVMDLDRNLPPVPCLPGEFNQAVLNLIVNAAHAIADVVGNSGKKGTIRITSPQVGEWAEIRVSDTGTGIPQAIRERIFDPFFTTKPPGKGTGQGLAIARSAIVNKHGGTLTFETEVGRGTTFIIRLPLKEPAERAWSGEGVGAQGTPAVPGR
jgi:PAS domain S-box-containing protein